MLWEGFYALLFSHVEDQTLLYQMLHLYLVVEDVVKNIKNSVKKPIKNVIPNQTKASN